MRFFCAVLQRQRITGRHELGHANGVDLADRTARLSRPAQPVAVPGGLGVRPSAASGVNAGHAALAVLVMLTPKSSKV